MKYQNDPRKQTRKSGRSRTAAPRPTPPPQPPTKVGPETPEQLLALYRPDLSHALQKLATPTYRQRQVLEHLMRPALQPFSQSTVLPVDIRVPLGELGATTLSAAATRTSADGTVKLLLACHDGCLIETVLMPYQKRTTVCISSQAGCPVGCSFCATGAAGFRRNLSVAEIVDQVRTAASVAHEMGGRISNIVFMGMGEPLLNLQAVLGSIRVITHPNGLKVGHRSLSVSTVGIPAGILRLARVEPQVNLAISLHASAEQTRELLIPARHRHPLPDILAAAWEHFALTRRKLMVEYVLLRGVNDSLEDARRLAAHLRGHVVTVNLLSWNPTSGDVKERACGAAAERTDQGRRGSVFLPSSPAVVAAFRNSLADAKIEVTMRASRGGDIEAACGQLAGLKRSYEEMDRPETH